MCDEITMESFENSTVATLIDSTARCWNEEVVDGLSAQSEAKKKNPCPELSLRMY